MRLDRLQLVFAHVFVHLAPAGKDSSFRKPAVDRVAIFDGAPGLAATAADGLGFDFQPSFLLGRIFQPQFLVDLIAGGQAEEDGDED